MPNHIAMSAGLGWVAAAGYVLVLIIATYRLRVRRPTLADHPPVRSGPLLSVVVPARDESVNIVPCLRSILATEYAPCEVIVVDDRSRDDTAALVRELAAAPEARGRVRLITGSDPPTGWFGKQWALVQGYRAAQGELLLFTDADTLHGAELIGRAVAARAAERADLLTVIPRQEMGSFWERLLQPHVFFVLGSRVGDLRRVNRTRTPWNAIANGQFILTPRAAYEAAGTHARVRDTVVDDLALAQTYVTHRLDVFVAHAQPFMVTRMYRSFRAIAEGWTKNLALGAPRMLPPWPGLRAAFPWVMWLPALAWIAPPVAWALTGSPFAAVATLASLALWAVVYRSEGAPSAFALLYPVATLIVAGIVIRSALRGRRVSWKGRHYDL
jgi:chlorobactene glucosyltransferase